MLLAVSHGLGTVLQAQAVAYPDVIRSVVPIPKSKLIAIGMAIGYPDWDNPVTRRRTEREPLDNIIEWHGFETSIQAFPGESFELLDKLSIEKRREFSGHLEHLRAGDKGARVINENDMKLWANKEIPRVPILVVDENIEHLQAG